MYQKLIQLSVLRVKVKIYLLSFVLEWHKHIVWTLWHGLAWKHLIMCFAMWSWDVFESGLYLQLPPSKGVLISLREKGGIITWHYSKHSFSPGGAVGDLNQTPQVNFRGRQQRKVRCFQRHARSQVESWPMASLDQSRAPCVDCVPVRVLPFLNFPSGF